MTDIRADLPAVLPSLNRFARSLRPGISYQDLVHDTVVRALESERTFDGRNLTAWMFTIMRHLVCNAKRRKPQLPTDPHADTFMRLEARSSLDAAVELAEVRRAIETLHPKYCAILLSAIAHDSDGQMVAADLGIAKLGTVKSRLNRARMELRGALA